MFDQTRLNDFLFRRTPDWDKQLEKDRFPHDNTYKGLYATKVWPSFTGTVHTWDRVRVNVPNDDGNWETWNIENDQAGSFGTDSNSGGTNVPNNCSAPPYCDNTRVFTGWGSTRNTYYKYHRDYQSPVFCFDHLRHVEMAIEQLDVIIEGHKELPNEIISTFLRKQSLWTSNNVYVCGSSLKQLVTGTTATFPTTRQLSLGSASNLPTSKLTMNYLNHYLPTLMYQGYHKRAFVPDAKFELMTDIQTIQDLCNANPALTSMYSAADFSKGGKYFAYGAMMGCGNWLMHVDTTPLRFVHIGGGVLQEIVPFQNVNTTVGKMPQFDPNYEKAPYQMFHVYNRACREIHTGDITSVNKDMPFGMARSLNGKWSWKTPDYFQAFDPASGQIKSYQNDKKNKGYFLGEYELGVKTIYPEIEMCIIALRESAPVADLPTAAGYETSSGAANLWNTFPGAGTVAAESMYQGSIYQQIVPYNGSPGYMCLD
jgi:hypothetical protein